MTSQTKRLALYTAAPAAFTVYALLQAHQADLALTSGTTTQEAAVSLRNRWMLSAGVGALATLFGASRAL